MTIKIQKIKTINELITEGANLFADAGLYFGHGTDNTLDEASYIVLGITKNLPLNNEQILSSEVSVDEQQKVLDAFERRIVERIPAAYLVGEAWFAGLPFFVDNNVLVPRSPFAELIEDRFAPWVDSSKINSILDLCTGSGCIGIASAFSFPKAKVDLADISALALNVANKNIQRHKLADRVEAIESDLFEGLANRQYDLIISNPPYVGHEELSNLPDEFYKEPQLGLDGGVSGLELVHNILVKAPEYLKEGGVLYVEVGNTDEALQQCYPVVPFLWQEFEYGGHGVFMLTKEQLLKYHTLFQAKLA
tara:strand:- start:2310 stop:3230 length:921 start_codon:yes stop_codon:yes gene_type:complete